MDNSINYNNIGKIKIFSLKNCIININNGKFNKLYDN